MVRAARRMDRLFISGAVLGTKTAPGIKDRNDEIFPRIGHESCKFLDEFRGR